MPRRDLLRLAAGGLAATSGGFRVAPARAAAAAGAVERHGLSIFGDLLYPPDFKHFAYVNPEAPHGGSLVIQTKNTSGNQNFDTFDTLNTFVLRGNGAAGMDATYDSLMAGSGDELGAMYGLAAQGVVVSPDSLTYRFRLRPEARFHDGSRLTARDVAFSIGILKEKGHPSIRLTLNEVASAEADGENVAVVTLTQNRSRELHLVVAGLPILSAAYWAGKDFEAATLDAPLGSGPYKVGRIDVGRTIEFDRVPDYWARDLPVNVGTNNFEHVRYEYFRDRQVAFEAFKNGTLTYNEEYTSRIWATGYDFPAVTDGRVKKETLPKRDPTPTQGWIFNLRRDQFKDPRIREALGLAFDFEWTNKNIMFGAYRRLTSYFENSDFAARGLSSPEEVKLLDPWRGKIPDDVFGEPWMPPVSDGSGSDRKLLRRADELLLAAGCRRSGSTLNLPDGRPFEIEFLDFSDALQPHTQPFQANLRRLGIDARSRIVDAAQYQRRVQDFDFDVITRAMGGASVPGDSLRILLGSQSGKVPGGHNVGGIDSPAVDALIEYVAKADTMQEVIVGARALDRVLRAGRYWIPMWWNPSIFLAFWDMYDRPETQPKYASGAPGTWWYDADKARRIGKG